MAQLGWWLGLGGNDVAGIDGAGKEGAEQGAGGWVSEFSLLVNLK